MICGRPRVDINLIMEFLNEWEVKSGTSSKDNALVDAQVNNAMYDLWLILAPLSFTYNGPAKSTPVLVNGGHSDNLTNGNGGVGGGLNGLAVIFLQVKYILD